MNLHDVIQKPLITEKSSIGRDELNLATFAVDPRANKQEIKAAVESMFDVKVVGAPAAEVVLRMAPPPDWPEDVGGREEPLPGCSGTCTERRKW